MPANEAGSRFTHDVIREYLIAEQAREYFGHEPGRLLDDDLKTLLIRAPGRPASSLHSGTC